MLLLGPLAPAPAQTPTTTAIGAAPTEREPRAHAGQWPLLPKSPARRQEGKKEKVSSLFPVPSYLPMLPMSPTNRTLAVEREPGGNSLQAVSPKCAEEY